eukprot:PITA_12229
MPFNDMCYAPSEIPIINMDNNSSTPRELALTLASGVVGHSKGEVKRRSRDVGKTRVDDEYESERNGVCRFGNDEDEFKRNGVWRGRHTAQQIQEMEAFFKMKFICVRCFQAPHDNATLRWENEILEIENRRMKEALKNCTGTSCYKCGGAVEMPFEERQLRLEKARLENELKRVTRKLCGMDKSSASGLAFAAMNEFIRMATMEHTQWISTSHDQYFRQFPRVLGPKPAGYRTEVNRYAGTVLMKTMNLVEILMDSKRYAEMFPSIVSTARTLEVLRNGAEGTRNGQLQLMHMELHLLSPLGPVREFYFLRFCQQLRARVWAIVDVSADSLPAVNCQRHPSGLLIQEFPSNCSTVTWVEHGDYDDRGVHSLYRPVVNSSLGFGSQRWLSELQHQCERLAILREINADGTAFSDPRGRQSLLKLAQRMTSDFCTSLSPSILNNWATLSGDGDEDIRVSTPKNVENPELRISAATSLWLPVTPQKSFDFLRDLNRRSQGINMDPGAFILQECCTNAWGSIIVYATFDHASMHTVMHGGKPDYVSVLPSGFVILPDNHAPLSTEIGISSSSSMQKRGRGSILTVAFQIVWVAEPASTRDWREVQLLISSAVQKIRSALILEDAS